MKSLLFEFKLNANLIGVGYQQSSEFIIDDFFVSDLILKFQMVLTVRIYYVFNYLTLIFT